MPYCIYLRKSRADIELESQGEMETLARHQKILLDLAKKLNLSISKVYKEIVSGETISERPEVQQLLNEVEDGIWDGVLVVEIERLARGDTIDQGIVARAFKYGSAKIITPNKTFDPNNEFDEEYFEFGLFMSRREYKTINRRIQRGRLEAVKEGKFIASTPPYGYNKVKVKSGKGYTLEQNEEAPVVKKIYELYILGNGMHTICDILDSMNIKPRNRDTWSKSTISDILKNPVYTGVIRWSYRPEKKTKDNQKIRYYNNECITVQGLHQPIITKDVYNKAQSLQKSNYRIPVKANLELKNPLTGLGYCSKCGTLLTRLGSSSKNKVDKLICPNKNCSTVSAPLYLVEKNIVSELKDIYNKYVITIETSAVKEDTSLLTKSISSIQNEIIKIDNQIAKTYDLLEQEIYSIEVFEKRNQSLTLKKSKLIEKLKALENQNANIKTNKKNRNEIIKAQAMLDNYYNIDSAEGRNKILRLLLNRFEYEKNNRNTKGNLYNENYSIKLYTLLPIS